MKKILYFFMVAMSLFLPGCSIWEDRAACPKILGLDCTLLEGKALEADIWIFNADGSLLLKSKIGEHQFTTRQEYQVKEGEYTCAVWSSIGANTIVSNPGSLSGTLLKSPGKDSDPLFSFISRTECRKDSVTVRVVPWQMFIDVSIVFRGMQDGEYANVDIVSSCLGYSLGREWLQGEGLVSASGRKFVKMRVSRPADLDNLTVHISYNIADGSTLVSDIDLGEQLKAAEYDISGPELKEVLITVDMTRMRAVIGTDPIDKMPPVFIRY